jgi:four helix bundle protein
MYPFRKLKVWHEAHSLVVRMHALTSDWTEQRFPGLRRQICRAASSIASNIAEGSARDTQAQFAHFLEIAIGSAAELDYFLTLAVDLGALSPEDAAPHFNDVSRLSRMLITLRKATRRPRTVSSRTKQDTGGTTSGPP